MSMNIGIEEHALLYGLLVKNAVALLGEDNGRKIMLEATRHYGNSRGRRMRTNADKLGLGCSTDAYLLTGELPFQKGESVSQAAYETDRVCNTVTECKWCRTWKDYDLRDYGPLYCQVIDKAIAEGFDGSFTLSVDSILSAGDDACRFVFSEPVNEAALKQNRSHIGQSLLKSFTFHSQELLQCTKEILDQECPAQTEQILKNTENDFRKLKPEAADTIFSC